MSQEINFTINGSLIDDYDILAETEPISFNLVMRWLSGIAEILKFVCGVLALASDIYLIVVISKFEALKTRINNFILQYAIYNLMFLLLANLIYLTVDIFRFRAYYYWSMYMFIGLVDDLTLYLSSFVLTFMACDWFVSNYYPNIYDQYKKLFKHGSYIVLLVATFLWIIVSILCIVEHESFDLVRLVLQELSFIFCGSVIIIVTVLKQKNRSCIEAYKTEYALTIPKTVFMLLSFYYTCKIYLELLNGNKVPRYLYQISYLFLYIAEILLLASPIVVVCQLIKINKHFRSAYIKSCNKKRVHNYDDDNLDADSLTETPAGNVTFDKDTVAISF